MEDDWYREPMRWLPLNPVADDPLHTDVGAWQAYWLDARVEGLTISAAGATAFYPTEVRLHAFVGRHGHGRRADDRGLPGLRHRSATRRKGPRR